MKRIKICKFLGVLASLPLASMWGQVAPVDLYLSPDINSPKLGAVRLGDPRLGDPAPVTDDAKAALGWQYARYNGTVTGFVPDARIGKDMMPVNDATIHSRPDPNSPILTVYKFGNPIEIIDTGAWWKLRVETSFPVYFVADTLPPASLVPESANPGPPPADIDSTTQITDDTTLFNETMELQEPQQQEQPTVSLNLQQHEPRKGIVARSYTGSLERSNRRIAFFKAKAPYQLIDNSGKRLLWVNFSESIMPGTINQYLGKDVIVHGERIRNENSDDSVLYIRTIREKH